VVHFLNVTFHHNGSLSVCQIQAVLFSVNIDVVPVVYAEGPARFYEGGWGGRSGALPLSGETVRFSDTNILEMWRHTDNYWRFERLIGGRLVAGQVYGERVARSITALQHAFVGTGDVTFIFNLPSNVINGIRDTRVRMGNPNFVPVARFDLRTDSQELLRSHGREHLGTLDISDIVESWNNPDYHIDLVAGTIELHFRPRFNFVTDPVTDLPIALSRLVGGERVTSRKRCA